MSCLMPSRSSTACQLCRSGWSLTGATPATPFASTSGTWALATWALARPSRPRGGAACLPGLDLRQPQPSGAALGAAEGVARRRDPLREDRLQLHGRPLPRRRSRLAQVITGLSKFEEGRPKPSTGAAPPTRDLQRTNELKK